jgi:hypothetical protein
MTTRFIHKAPLTAALGIALSVLAAATTAPSAACVTAAGAIQLDPPAAPSNCRTRTINVRDRRKGDFTYTTVAWRDNSGNEDGFTVEQWWQNQSGDWALVGSFATPANSTAFSLLGRYGSNYRFRVKAFNASGDSSWTNWTR